jgi:hypothetical protein
MKIFGSRKKRAGVEDNPYASSPAKNSYTTPQADPYAQETTKYSGMPALPVYQKAAPPYETYSQQSTPPPTGLGAERYGSSGAYGTDRYSLSQSRGPSGYGGLVRTRSADTDTPEHAKTALFGAARHRYPEAAQRQMPIPNKRGLDSYEVEFGGGYACNTYEERQLIAEEEEVRISRIQCCSGI